jgi:hypothetical protein
MGNFQAPFIQACPCTKWLSLVSPPQRNHFLSAGVGSDQETKDVVQDWLNCLAAIFSTKAYNS